MILKACINFQFKFLEFLKFKISGDNFLNFWQIWPTLVVGVLVLIVGLLLFGGTLTAEDILISGNTNWLVNGFVVVVVLGVVVLFLLVAALIR